jgi:predicted ATPase/DNA-binding SARP family transcriptional activator
VDRLRVTLLGTFGVCRGDTALPVAGARLRGLLVRLALAGGRPVGPITLVGALWPEQSPADPANALQSLVSRLRRMLGAAGAVQQVEGGYRLDVVADDVDALRFERLAADGRARLRAGDPRSAVSPLDEALALWHAHPGTEPAAIAAVAPSAATRLARVSLEAGADLAEAELESGRIAEAAARLTALLAEHPAHERMAALLMDALVAQGRQTEALDLYEQVRAAIADRLGADPGAALRERHLRVLRSPPAGPADTPAPPGNLPAALTSFIGRDDDLARIGTLLAAGRLVTVAGPGGAGKTRLALEAGRRHAHEYPDGTWLVDLAAVTEPAKVGAAVLAAAGLRGAAMFEGPGRVRAEGDELDVLADQLNGRQSLLVVDNCEHLIDAVAHLTAALLTRCAGLRVLATSREPLAIDGEALVPLGPLTLPEPGAGIEQARRTTSVRLFTERAAAVRPGFDVDEETLGDVLRVVRGLDGMPLALELAAARLRTLSLAELADGLSDRFRLLTTGSRTAFPRHRTLRAVIAWSWDLLGENERTVAERVSILPGGVTPASAAAVCAGTPVAPAEVPELLAALVDRSLLQLAPEPGRYRMLETLREYGIDRLAAEGTLDAVRGLAAGHFAELMARYDPQLRGPGQLAALRVIRAEYDNALASLRHLCDHRDAAAAIDLALHLAWYWQMAGRHADAVSWLGEALALPAGEHSLRRDTAEAILLLNRLGNQPAAVADVTRRHESELRRLTDRLLAYPSLPGLAGALTAMSLHFLREADASQAVLKRLMEGPDVWLAGLARMFHAQVAENGGDLDRVRVDVAAALECFERAGDRWGVATVLPMRAMLRQYDGDLDGALSDLRGASSRAREFGSLSLSDEIFIDLRWIDLHLRRGDLEPALARIDEARERAARSTSPELIILVDALEAGVWMWAGDLDRGQEVLERAEAALAGASPVGGDHGRALVGAVRTWLCVEGQDATGAEAALARAYEGAMESRDMPLLAMVAVAAASLAGLRGRHRDAAQMLGAAARLRGTHDHTDPQVRELSRRGRVALGEDGFARAYEKGWGLDGKAALAETDPARLRRPPEIGAHARRA